MQENKYFADTYALMEIIKQSLTHSPFHSFSILTTKWNLAEMYYNLVREYNVPTANYFLSLWQSQLVAVTNTSIQKGMQFKFLHRKEKLSHIDCIGYAMAKELGIKFLTGDVKFKGLKNVEFVV